MYDEFTDGGKTEIDWAKAFYDASDLARTLDWETFNEKGYHIISAPERYEPKPCLRWFAEGRACDTPDTGNPKRNIPEKAHELGTYSGKIEFSSESLKAHFPDDQERPVSPRYIESWEGHHTTELFEKYPLQLMSPHPRFSFHCHYDKHTDWLDDIPVHRIKKDGYAWWPARLHPADADARGIRNGDLVRLYNDRGSVLCAAVVTERVRPGHHPQLRLVGQVRPARAGQVRLHRQGRLRERAHAVAHAEQARARHDAQLVPHRRREVGGLIR